MKENIPKVDEWIAPKDSIYIYPDGKSVIIPFGKIFNKLDVKLDNLSVFIIKKEVYTNEIEIITHYVNYFINFFDKKKELPVAYLRVKYFLDNRKCGFNSDEQFIEFMYDTIISDDIIDAIVDMVEYNYNLDVEKSEIEYIDELKFTNEHTKLLLQVSTAMKILIPVIMDYLNKMDKIKDTDLLYKCFHELFNIFGEDDEGENIYNKLYITILTRIKHNMKPNKLIWDKQEIFGNDIGTFADILFKARFVCGVMFKYNFMKHLLSLNLNVFDSQLGYFNKENFGVELKEMNTERDNISNLSPADKLEMESAKLDESMVVLSNCNIPSSMKKIMKKMRYKITEDEIEYYRILHKEEKFQKDLKLYFFAKYFGGFKDLHLISNRHHIILTIMMKRYLQVFGNVYLPILLTSNVSGKISRRIIRNNKFLTKIETSDVFKNLMEEKFATLEELDKKDYILGLLSTLLNTKFVRVDFDNRELLGEEVEVNQDKLCDEFLNFLNQI